MNQDVQNTETIEIDLKEIFFVLWKKLGIIILSGALLALVAMIFTQLFVAPKYVSKTTMYVLNRQSSDTITNSDVQSSTYLTKDYAVMIKSRTVIEATIAQLGLDLTYEEMLNKVSVSTTTDTRVLEISVTDTDPYVAQEIASTVRDAAAAHIRKVMVAEAVNVVDEANIPNKKSGPSVMKNGVIAGVIGCFLAVVIVLVLYILNDTIKTQDDVEHYLGLSTLGNIPLSERALKARKMRKKKAKAGEKSRRGKR